MKPIVLVPSDLMTSNGHESYKCGDKYLRALAELSGVTPLIIPSLESELDLRGMLSRVDGVMLTGGLSNVHPSFMAEKYQTSPVTAPSDTRRDAITIALIREAIDRGKPLLGICRGLQEINVALGGSLHPLSHEVPHYFDHRQPAGAKISVQYGPNHLVTLEPGGVLDSWIDEKSFMVNSLHWQAVADVAPGLKIEALSNDGLVEAASLPSAASLALAVQWHPEFNAAQNPQSLAIFCGFRRAIDGGQF